LAASARPQAKSFGRRVGSDRFRSGGQSRERRRFGRRRPASENGELLFRSNLRVENLCRSVRPNRMRALVIVQGDKSHEVVATTNRLLDSDQVNDSDQRIDRGIT
jgi:hypothetical protein